MTIIYLNQIDYYVFFPSFMKRIAILFSFLEFILEFVVERR